MTCSTCGNVLAQDARFCPRCGAQAAVQPSPQPGVGYVPIATALREYRVSRNLHTLGTLWLCYAALRFLVSIFAVLFLHGMLGRHFGHSDFTFGWSPFGRMGMDGLWPIAIFSLMMSVQRTGCARLRIEVGGDHGPQGSGAKRASIFQSPQL